MVGPPISPMDVNLVTYSSLASVVTGGRLAEGPPLAAHFDDVDTGQFSGQTTLPRKCPHRNGLSTSTSELIATP